MKNIKPITGYDYPEAVEIGLWHAVENELPTRLLETSLKLEEHLETWLYEDPTLIAPSLLRVRRQVCTCHCPRKNGPWDDGSSLNVTALSIICFPHLQQYLTVCGGNEQSTVPLSCQQCSQDLSPNNVLMPSPYRCSPPNHSMQRNQSQAPGPLISGR